MLCQFVCPASSHLAMIGLSARLAKCRRKSRDGGGRWRRKKYTHYMVGEKESRRGLSEGYYPKKSAIKCTKSCKNWQAKKEAQTHSIQQGDKATAAHQQLLASFTLFPFPFFVVLVHVIVLMCLPPLSSSAWWFMGEIFRNFPVFSSQITNWKRPKNHT